MNDQNSIIRIKKLRNSSNWENKEKTKVAQYDINQNKIEQLDKDSKLENDHLLSNKTVMDFHKQSYTKLDLLYDLFWWCKYKCCNSSRK